MSAQITRIEERIIQEILLIVGMVLLALLQVLLLPAPLGFPPALLLPIVVSRALIGLERAQQWNYDATLPIRWAFYGGIALDFLSVTPLGSHALALIVAVVIVTIIAGRLHMQGPMLTLLAVLLAALVYEAILALIYALTNTWIDDWYAYARYVMLPSMLLVLVPTLPIFLFLRWLVRRRQEAAAA